MTQLTTPAATSPMSRGETVGVEHQHEGRDDHAEDPGADERGRREEAPSGAPVTASAKTATIG